MKLGKGSYRNFGSYAELEIDFQDLGLTLISGQTGSGKSSLMDAPAWALYGRTSKDGTADSVKRWGASVEAGATTGIQCVSLPDGNISVHRLRGGGSNNDLYWTEEGKDDAPIRGKNIIETQDLLEKRLGVSSDLYFISAYFSQFSQSDSFFTAKAAQRRETLESISDLSLAVRIGGQASGDTKRTKQSLQVGIGAQQANAGRIGALTQSIASTNSAYELWEGSHRRDVAELRAKREGFSSESRVALAAAASRLESLDAKIVEPEKINFKIQKVKEEIKALDEDKAKQAEAHKKWTEIRSSKDSFVREYERHSKPGKPTCPTCLGPSDNPNKKHFLAELKDKIATLEHQESLASDSLQSYTERVPAALEAVNDKYSELLKQQRANDSLINDFERAKADYIRLEAQTNPYEEQLKKAENAVNPHDGQLEEMATALNNCNIQKVKIDAQVKELETRLSALGQLYDLSMVLRGKLLEGAVKQIQDSTNACLDKYFDGEIKVAFELSADKLDVTIQKNGYECGFKALSGGQRCMLKLAFTTSLMEAAANNAGVHFDTLFLDEALNGLDEGLKVKAFGLLEQLSLKHSSVLVIDHCEEFKNLFNNRYDVTIESDISTLTKA